jgi:hypothetical protein
VTGRKWPQSAFCRWFLAVVVIGFPIPISAWIWGIINGHSSAVTWNRNHGIIS